MKPTIQTRIGKVEKNEKRQKWKNKKDKTGEIDKN